MLAGVLSTTLLVLCGAGLLVSWMPGQFAWHVFEALVFALLSLWAIAWGAGYARAAWSWLLAPLLGAALCGAVQLWTGWSVYPFATSTDVLRWLTYAALFFLALQAFSGPAARTAFRRAVTVFALVLAIVSVFQHFLGNGRIFWLFTSEEGANMGPFLNRDHYASFIALALPVAVFEMLRRPRQSWFYALTAAVLYASAIAGASRAGFLLLTVELVVLALLVALSGRAVLALAGLIVVLGFVVGWDTLYQRLQERDPYAGRREVALSTIDMFHAEPWKGFGLGAWTEVYPAYARRDFGVFINAAHNDWLQWAAEGGIPLLACMLAIFVASARLAVRTPWALGIPIVFLHSTIDFPLQGRFLPAAVYLLLGIAAGSRLGSEARASASAWQKGRNLSVKALVPNQRKRDLLEE